MIGIVIVTHGRLAQEIISAMEHMVGPQTHLRAVCVGPEDDVERRQREIAAAAKSVDLGRGVVIVTDMYGGTPCNLALTLLDRGKIEGLAAANICAPVRPISWAERERMDEPVARRAKVRIVNKKGLHARASAKMVEAAARFQSCITVS